MNAKHAALLFTLPLLSACGDDTPATSGEPAQVIAACEASFQVTEPNPNYPWTPNAIRLVSKQVGPGTFVVYDERADDPGSAGYPLATTGGFVIGDDGVLLVETMINRQLFCQQIALVREQTDLPILYAVNTSHHGDHSYGNAFLPDSVQVIQHERTASFIQDPQLFAGDIAFMEANFGADQGIAEVTSVAADIEVGEDGWSVDLGGRTVEARYYGFGQTHGDLFVYAPDADVLWTGNPLIARSPAIPWLLDGHAHEVEVTLSAVRDALPASTIVPGHDAPLTATAFDFSIDYLATLQSEIGGAVAAGQTLEETVASVTMEPFQGYALWGWVHSAVNVPVTYEELSQESP